ncbi:MAG TPA: serine/threonine-protein kinase [Gemmatimonadales bacterium]|nr:serine/threonine-protein kinase [Gemmatimonadales bacterium]
MPDDLLDESRKRLSVIAFLGSVLWFTATALFHLARRAIAPDDPVWMRLGAPDLVAVINVTASAALCAWTRRSRKAPELLVRASLAYMVFTCLSIAIIWHSDPAFHTEQVTPMISWSGVVVMMFAAIIPIRPKTMVLTGLVCVAMNPVAMFILQRMGVTMWGSPEKVVLMHYPDFLIVGIAGAISVVMTKLGHQVSRAREMGSYHLGELIGRGGMGEVYQATHRMLARKAAIKLIRRSSIAPGDAETTQLAIARFRREAEVAASLRCPHTVALYDFGTTPDGALYIVMEFLEGMDLETLIRKEGAQPWQRVVSIMRQACESLAEAHARGLVHRDIKPANLHIGRLGLQDDFVKVLDFGLVKSIGTREQPAAQTLATRDGQTPGTPEFMPPEMALGEEVDGRADIYALGCVAFYLLTGRPVFEGTSAYHLIARHLNDPAPPPSTATTSTIPAELDAIILACLRKRPDERPTSAIELGESLARLAA